VGENPSGFSIGKQAPFFGYNGRLFDRLLGTIRSCQQGKYAKLKVHRTYAVLAGAVEPSADHIRYCQPNLLREILSVRGVTPSAPVIVTLGATALKALNIHVKRLTDVVGRFLTTTLQTPLGPKQYKVMPLFSMAMLERNPGFANVAVAGLLQASQLAIEDAAPQAASMDDLTKDYRYPKTIEEVDALVTEVINYADPESGKGPEQWFVAIDTETNVLQPHRRPDPKTLMLSVAWDDGKAATILLDHPETPYDPKAAWVHVQRLLQCPKPKGLHHWQYDRKFLEEIQGIPVNNVSWDSLCGEHFCDEDKKGLYGLKKLTPIYTPAYTGYDDDLQKLFREEKTKKTEVAWNGIGLTPLPGKDPYLWSKLLEVTTDLVAMKALPKVERDAGKLKDLTKQAADLYKKLGLAQPKRGSKKDRRGKPEKSKDDKGFEEITLDVILRYAAVDADVTRQISKAQFQRMATAGTVDDGRHVMKYLYLPASRVLSKMETHGLKVDTMYLDKVDQGVTEMLIKAENELKGKFGIINYSSPAQVSALMAKMNFDRLPGVDPSSTSKDIMGKYAKHYPIGDLRHEFAETLLVFRAAHKTKTGFLQKIRSMSAYDGRVHGSFFLTGTATGRLCVSGDTQLVTNKGTFQIKDLPEDPELTIVTHRGRPKRILHKIFKGYEAMFRVTTADGKSIICTGGHRFWTPGGWRCLNDLKIGAPIATADVALPPENDNTPTLRSNTSGNQKTSRRLARRHICEVRYPQGFDPRAIAQEFRCKLQYVEHQSGVLQGQICCRASTAKTRALCTGDEREPTRAQRSTRNNLTTRKARNDAQAWLRVVRTGNRIEDISVVCAREYTALRFENEQKVAVQNAGHRLRLPSASEGTGTGDSGRRGKLLQRPAPIFHAVASLFCAPQRIGMVCSFIQKAPRAFYRERTHSARPHQLVEQPGRDAVIDGATGRGDSASTRDRCGEEVHCRFSISCGEIDSRSRWSFPSPRHANAKTRQAENHRTAPKWIPATPGDRRRSLQEFTRRGSTCKTGIIEKITPVGVRGVWDIEVEEDHSYIAQGFVNHNSSSSPNLQNIPKYMCRFIRRENGNDVVVHKGFNIKKLFIPANPDNIMVNVDIKGAELRVYTAYSDDEKMIDALTRGLDVHSYTASMITGIPYETFEREKESNPDIKAKRTMAKRVIFGIFYGAGAYKISEQIEKSVEEAQAVIDQVYMAYPKLRAYTQDTHQKIRTQQFVRTLFGRYRRFRYANSNKKNFAEACREAVNFLIQSTASDLVLSQLCEISDNIHTLSGEMLVTVHDSITFEMPAQNLDIYTTVDAEDNKHYVDRRGDLHAFLDKWIVQRVAEKYDWLPVPFLYDVETGPSYGETKALERHHGPAEIS